jgi:hypothetical protein
MLPGIPLAADFGGWITLIIIAWAAISGIATAIRRATRTAQAKASARPMTTAATTTATISDDASQAPDSSTRAQRLEHVIQAIAAKAQASTAAADLQQKLYDLSAGASNAPALGHGQVMSDLHAVTVSSPSSTSAPLTMDMERSTLVDRAAGRVRSTAPFDLAQAVINAAIVGPCVALRSAPQEPGGW